MRLCQHCGVSNDDTRVFCGNCGTRLPKSSPSPGPEGSGEGSGEIPQAGSSAPPLPPAPRRAPIKPAKAQAPAERSLLLSLASGIFWMAVVSATLAAIIQMVRPPDNIPAPVGINSAAAHETFTTLQDLAASPKAISWIVNSKAINQYLETTIEMKTDGASTSKLSVRFKRCLVLLHEGSFSLAIEQQFLGASLYFVLNLEPVSTGSGCEVKQLGGAIGRLPIHPSLLPTFLRLFQPTLDGLAEPIAILSHAKSVTVTPSDATLQWSGTGKPVSR
jgi:hypothetical protein